MTLRARAWFGHAPRPFPFVYDTIRFRLNAIATRSRTPSLTPAELATGVDVAWGVALEERVHRAEVLS